MPQGRQDNLSLKFLCFLRFRRSTLRGRLAPWNAAGYINQVNLRLAGLIVRWVTFRQTSLASQLIIALRWPVGKIDQEEGYRKNDKFYVAAPYSCALYILSSNR